MFVYNLQNYSGSGIYVPKSAKSANSGDGKCFVSKLLSKHCLPQLGLYTSIFFDQNI